MGSVADRVLREQARDTDGAIVAEHLRRVYHTGSTLRRNRKETIAVEDISFSVPRGTIFGILGPNGAGKTTTIKMLSTLLAPSAGTARVHGYDVRRDEQMVRRQLGVVLGGDRGLYGQLSAWDNLLYFGTLYGMRKEAIGRRGELLLDLVGLRGRAGDRVERYSRGMKQRLHLAKALLHDPPVLFLDEPSIGLDPAAAVDLRKAIAALAPAHTVLLTTHDMFEADLLCREIAIVNRGRIVAQGSPTELKARVAGTRRVVVSSEVMQEEHVTEIEPRLSRLPGVQQVNRVTNAAGGSEWTLLCVNTSLALDGALAILRGVGAPVTAVQVFEPTLEDAFLATAGSSLS